MVNFFIKTYGCQANEADSAQLRRYLFDLGCCEVEQEQGADLIIVNTCAIRQKAEDKIFSYLGRLATLHVFIAVIGCIASYKKQEIKSKFHHVSLVFGAKDDISLLKAELAEVVEGLKTKKSIFQSVPAEVFNPRSMIPIMRGCNNYCSYCIVPFTTGRERSFSMSGILEQLKKDVDRGAKDILLLGQNVNSYKDPETGATFEVLLEKVAAIDGDFWVRFVSPHPKDMTLEVLDVMAAHPKKLCSFIHVPLQSGSNRILELMNRTYTAEEYLLLIEQIKRRLPAVTISTDIIVGFPHETEEDYLASRQIMEQVRFQMIFSFIYSPRAYTLAAKMPDNCSHEVKQQRLKALQVRHREIGTQVNRELIGKTVRVLLEEDKGSVFIGRTEGNIRVLVTGVGLRVNQFVDVEITQARLSDITGVVI